MDTIYQLPPRSRPCTCPAYPFPHREGGGRCQGALVCPHNVRLPHHPDYDRREDYCNECAFWELVDHYYERQKEA